MHTLTNIFSLLMIVLGALFALAGFSASGVSGAWMIGWLGVVMLLLGGLVSHVAGKKTCPHCQETVKFNAVKCKHCQSSLA